MHCKELLDDFTWNSTRSSGNELQKTLTNIFMPGRLQNKRQNRQLLQKTVQNLDKRTSRHPPTKAFIQEYMAPAKFSRKDLPAWIPPGSPQDLLLRICAASCKDLWEKTSPGSPHNHVIRSCVRSCNHAEGPLTGRQQDLHKIFSWGNVQDDAIMHCLLSGFDFQPCSLHTKPTAALLSLQEEYDKGN